MDMRWRQTHDLDLSVSIALHEYSAGLEAPGNWTKDPHLPHRWISPYGVRVDILPIDAKALDERRLEWPDGRIMKLVGSRLVFSESIACVLSDELTLDVAPLPVITLLKMVAYQDRPYERESDLADIGFILTEGIEAGDDDRYSELVVSRGLDHDHAGPFLIGKRLGEIANEEEKAAAKKFASKAMDEEDVHTTHVRLASVGPPGWRRSPAHMVSCLDAFRDGLRLA